MLAGGVVAIDGHAACGKSTVAKRVAQLLRYDFMSSGMMYRAATALFLRYAPTSSSLEEQIKTFDWQLLRRLRFVFSEEHILQGWLQDEKLLASTLYSLETSQVVATLSQSPTLRAHLRAVQRGLAAKRCVVVEGRDTGTEVFPRAFLKVFMTASLALRVERRYKEFLRKGERVSKTDILRTLSQRDHMDETRAVGKLQKPKDALLLDTSKMTADAVAAQIAHKVRTMGGGCS